jgi:uncharacterized membrane protein
MRLTDVESPAHIRAGGPILILISVLGSLLGIVLLVGGLVIAFVQRFAETKFTLLGNEFSSTSVGVSIAFIGAILVIATFRRVLKSLDHLAALKDD